MRSQTSPVNHRNTKENAKHSENLFFVDERLSDEAAYLFALGPNRIGYPVRSRINVYNLDRLSPLSNMTDLSNTNWKSAKLAVQSIPLRFVVDRLSCTGDQMQTFGLIRTLLPKATLLADIPTID